MTDKEKAIRDIKHVIKDKKMYLSEKKFWIKTIDIAYQIGLYSEIKGIFYEANML